MRIASGVGCSRERRGRESVLRSGIWTAATWMRGLFFRFIDHVKNARDRNRSTRSLMRNLIVSGQQNMARSIDFSLCQHGTQHRLLVWPNAVREITFSVSQ